MAIVKIENAGVEAEVMLENGGRIVSFNRKGLPNVLEVSQDVWNEPVDQRLCPSPSLMDFRAYNGHEVWLGPQSQWWKQQTLNQEKIDSLLFWPPDPYISYGDYSILKYTTNEVVIVGDVSPISGIRFEKSIVIDETGALKFTVKARNLRETPVSWDLWLITRVNGHNPNFVPVASPEDVRLGEPSHPWQGNPTYKVENGFFSFTPLNNDGKFEECTGKAYIKASKPMILSKCGAQWLSLEFEHHDESLIHPEHTEIELYNFVHKESSKSLLELEYHAPYCTLQPGEEMSTWSRWTILTDVDKKIS